jgi:hypothetical protein
MAGKLSHEDIRMYVVSYLRSLLNSLRKEGVNIPNFLVNKDVDLLIQHEVKVGKGYVDMLFREVVFEIKRSKREFGEAERKAREVYLPHLPQVKYFIITNYDEWIIYEVKREDNEIVLLKIREGKLDEIKDTLREILAKIEPKYPATPQAVKVVFSEVQKTVVKGLREAYGELGERVRPFFEAYKSMIKLLYPKAGEDELLELFLRHTFMHMAVMAVLTQIYGKSGDPADEASGVLLDVDVALPYLNWWKESKNASEIAAEVTVAAKMLDWGQSTGEDVFRVLYEELIDERTRRQIGEYYTPVWMTEWALNHFQLKDKTVLDPFCGSGTFLVTAFYKKVVKEGEPADKAYSELVGFDINPLAVAVARAELILAYYRKTSNTPDRPPAVYHVDTLAAWFARRPAELPHIREAINAFTQNFDISVVGGKPFADVVKDLVSVEWQLSYMLNDAWRRCRDRGDKIPCIEQSLRKAAEGLPKEGLLGHLRRTLLDTRLPQFLARYVAEGGGNGVWSAVFVSALIPKLIGLIKPDVVATNPPWIHITEFKADYAKEIREYLRGVIEDFSKQLQASGVGWKLETGSVLNGGDVAQAALAKSLEVAQDGVVFVMNKDQLFNSDKWSYAGLVAAAAVVKTKARNHSVKLVDVEFDAFGHGIPPALIIAKRGGGGVELYAMDASKRPEKSANLGMANISVNRLDIDYEEYVKTAVEPYLDKPRKEALGATRIIPKGLYIMGLLGGERRKGAEAMAGLALDLEKVKRQAPESWRLELWLTGLSKPLKVPPSLWHELEVGIYRVVYVGRVNPFCWREPLYVILSRAGENKLKEFLQRVLEANKKDLPKQDIARLQKLIEEVKAPKPWVLNPDKAYVVFRTDRVPSAVVIKPDGSDIVVESHVGAVEFADETLAYYFAAAINYLAYKNHEAGRGFKHHNFKSVIEALINSGLASAPKQIKEEVAELSKKLHVKKQGRLCSDFANQAQALENLKNHSEFIQIVNKLDKVVRKEDLEKALRHISERSSARDGRAEGV